MCMRNHVCRSTIFAVPVRSTSYKTSVLCSAVVAVDSSTTVEVIM